MVVKYSAGQTGCLVDPLEIKLRDCQTELNKYIVVLRSPDIVNRELLANDLEFIQDMLEEAISISKSYTPNKY